MSTHDYEERMDLENSHTITAVLKNSSKNNNQERRLKNSTTNSHPRAMLNAGDTKTNTHIKLVLEEPIAIYL